MSASVLKDFTQWWRSTDNVEPPQTFVLGFFVDPKRREVILQLKKRKIAAGYLSGSGGKVELYRGEGKRGELPGEALCREAGEECGVRISHEGILYAGLLQTRENVRDPSAVIRICHLYFIYKWEGEICDSVELGEPETFSVDKLPSDRIMPSDRQWMGHLFADEPVRGFKQGFHEGVDHAEEDKRILPVFWTVTHSLASLHGFT